MRLFRSILLLMLIASTVPLAALGALLAVSGANHLAAPGVAAAGVLSAALAVGLSAWFARRLSRPVGEVVRGALDIAGGRFGRQVPVTVRNEIGELAYTFNHMSRELERYDDENRQLIAALEAGYLETIRSLASAIDAKDPYTRGHSQRVSALAVEIGREMGLDEADLKALAYGGLLHDIGKIGVPEGILRKTSSLEPDEMALMRSHPAIGSEILKDVTFLRTASLTVRSHHERWDGQGYPDGLAGEAIPLLARIVNAADTFDACSSNRPYQPAMGLDEVLAILRRLDGSQLDPAVHGALVRVAQRRLGARAEHASSPAASADHP